MWGFSLPGTSSTPGRDRVRSEGDGKHKANLPDLNGGFRFPRREAMLCMSLLFSWQQCKVAIL